MRSIIYVLVCFILFCSNALAGCAADQVVCMSSCATELMLSRPRDGGMGCNNRCLTAANACEAREAQQQQMEQQQQAQRQQQQQQAAERQAQQARDAKEIAGNRQQVQQAGEIAQQVGAEAAIQQQFDTALEKGMLALDQKGYITAEYQFKAALKIKPNNIDAKAGLLHAILGAGKRAAALTYANEQLLALAAKPPGADGRSTYAHWLEVLGDNGLANDAEREQLERIYPFGGGDPESAAAAFPKANPKSSFLPFVRQIGSAMPAIRADYADRRREVADAAAKDKEITVGVGLIGSYYLTDISKQIGTYSTRIVFKKVGNGITAVTPTDHYPDSRGVLIFQNTLTNLIIEKNNLTFNLKQQVNSSWTEVEVSAELKGDLREIPIRVKQINGNIGTNGYTDNRFLILTYW